jgi:hypothetical protein
VCMYVCVVSCGVVRSVGHLRVCFQFVKKGFDVYAIGTQECERSIAKSFVYASKARWVARLQEFLGAGTCMRVCVCVAVTEAVWSTCRLLSPTSRSIYTHTHTHTYSQTTPRCKRRPSRPHTSWYLRGGSSCHSSAQSTRARLPRATWITWETKGAWMCVCVCACINVCMCVCVCVHV